MRERTRTNPKQQPLALIRIRIRGSFSAPSIRSGPENLICEVGGKVRVDRTMG